MDPELLLRWLHVIGATVLLGTGAGIAFFMVMAVRSRDARTVAAVSRIVVVADVLFTATAVVAQPVTGLLLARAVGWPLGEGWIVLSIMLYVLTGALWLPVVAIQIRLRNMAEAAASAGAGLDDAFMSLYRIWFALGVPAFIAVLAILWLMLARPSISLWELAAWQQIG